MNAIYTRLALRALACAAFFATSPVHAAEADAEVDAKKCHYVNIASVPVSYTGPFLTLTMEGSLNGTPARLLVETGAGNTSLTRTGTEARGMSLWHTGARSMGIGGDSRVYRTRFKEFRAGPASATNGELTVLHDFGFAPSYDGIVGAPFLLQADLEISLAEKLIRFFRPADCGERHLAYWDPQATVIPLQRFYGRSPVPRFTVLLNGKKLTAIIDSGSASTMVTLGAAKRAGLKLDAPGVERMGDAVGIGESRVATWATVFNTLQLGEETIRNAKVGVLDTDLGDIDVMFGADFLRSHRVLFAMSQRKLYLTYVGGEALSPRRGLEPWMQQEADSGNTDAQMTLAAIYRSGRGVPRDLAQAQAWLERAAAGGNPSAHFAIGRNLMPRRDYAGAARHLRLGLEKLPGDRNASLVLYLARLHLGEAEAAQRDLEQAFARDDKDQWPNPVARHFLGKLNEEQLLEEARDDKTRARGQVCMAKTMMAERVAAMGDKEKAKALMAQRPECAAPPAPPGNKAT